MLISAGGGLGRHPAASDQLFLVVEGKGWVSGSDGERLPIEAGEGVIWIDNEEHESGSDSGMTVVIVQSNSSET